MTFLELKQAILSINAPDDAEVFMDDVCTSEDGEVISFDLFPAAGLVRFKEVDYSDPVLIGTEFDLKGLGIDALCEMNSRLGTGVKPAVIFFLRALRATTARATAG